MENTIAFDENVLTQKHKMVVAYLEANNPDILDYYTKTELEEFIHEKVKHYYAEYEKNMLLGFQAPEAEEIATAKLLNFQTSYSKLHEILAEKYSLSIDVSDLAIQEKIFYFSKEYRALIDQGKNISTLIESFFLN